MRTVWIVVAAVGFGALYVFVLNWVQLDWAQIPNPPPDPWIYQGGNTYRAEFPDGTTCFKLTGGLSQQFWCQAS